MEERSSCPGGRHRHRGERGAPSTQGRQQLLNLVLGSSEADARYLHPRDLVLLHTLVFMD